MKNGLWQWVAAKNTKFSLFKRGRLSRLEFLRNYTISYLLSFALFFVSLASSIFPGGDGTWQHVLSSIPVLIIFSIFGLVIYVVTTLIYIFAFIQRAHDFNKSGWFTLLLLIPLVNFIILLIFIFKKGDLADNKYGPASAVIKDKRAIIWSMVLAFVLTIVFIIVGMQKLNFPTAGNVISLTSQPSVQEKALLLTAKNDPFVTYVRTAINNFNAGETGSVDLSEYQSYLQSKFVLMQINNAAVMGGKDMLIAFTDKPDKFFYVWIYKQGDGAYDLRAFTPSVIPAEEVKKIYDNARPMIEELELAM